jgi:hypothetical protein
MTARRGFCAGKKMSQENKIGFLVTMYDDGCDKHEIKPEFTAKYASLVDAYRVMGNARRVSNMYGIGENIVRGVLRDSGVELRNKNPLRKKKNGWDRSKARRRALWFMICKMRSEGDRDNAKIADALNIEEREVVLIMRHYLSRHIERRQSCEAR